MATVVAVFVYDTQIYNMTVVASRVPSEVVIKKVAEVDVLKSEQHIHPVTSLSSGSAAQQTAIQPRNENDKKYMSGRRRASNTFDNGYNWPSI